MFEYDPEATPHSQRTQTASNPGHSGAPRDRVVSRTGAARAGIPAELRRFSTVEGVAVSRDPAAWPEGFRAAGVAAGLKASGGLDLMVLVNEGPSDRAAGLFTANRFCAAPVLWSRQVLADGRARVVAANSGGANACTGPQGFQMTHSTAELAGGLTGVSAGDVLVASTGLIGEPLPADRITQGVSDAVSALGDSTVEQAARAIMTTDTVPKRAEVILSSGARIVGIAKGAGMLAPQLATMLVFIATDAAQDDVQSPLAAACAVSFDHADADGCQSTNDTVVLLSSGSRPGVPAEEFESALTSLCQDLAYQLIDDAEGAAHTIAVTCSSAASVEDARQVCRAISRSNLVKTAIFGSDPNWGRILSSVGTTAAAFSPENVTVSMNGVVISRAGGLGEDRSLVDLSGREVSIVVDLGEGSSEATILTSDLTHDYVHENSAYSS